MEKHIETKVKDLAQEYGSESVWESALYLLQTRYDRPVSEESAAFCLFLSKGRGENALDCL